MRVKRKLRNLLYTTLDQDNTKLEQASEFHFLNHKMSNDDNFFIKRIIYIASTNPLICFPSP